MLVIESSWEAVFRSGASPSLSGIQTGKGKTTEISMHARPPWKCDHLNGHLRKAVIIIMFAFDQISSAFTSSLPSIVLLAIGKTGLFALHNVQDFFRL